MTLRLGSKLTAELNHIGHPSGLSHLAFTSACVILQALSQAMV